jgi:hypothetical protein
MTDWLPETIAMLMRIGVAASVVWAAMKVPFDALGEHAEPRGVDLKPWVAWGASVPVAWLAGLDPFVPLGAEVTWHGYVWAAGLIAAGAKVPHQLVKQWESRS